MALKDKEVIDLTPKEVKEEKDEDLPIMFFTVSLLSKSKPTHVLVRAESALQALQTAQVQLKAPVVGVHITEYSHYIDAMVGESEEKVEEVESKLIT